MPETSYWYLATAPLSVPYWPEVTMLQTEVGEESVISPMLFTTRKGAESYLQALTESEADAYLWAIEEYGEDAINKAIDNSPEQQVFEIGSWLLGEHLKDSALMYVTVDGQLRLAWELAEKLRRS